MNPTALSSPRQWNVASVSFLNAKPLIEGLDREPSIRLHLQVPSALLGGLQDNRFDVALLPVIDYQRLSGLRLIPSGGIGCNGPTLTVRLFSRRPLEQTRVLLCDTDSHTSVALARVIFAERFSVRPQFVDLSDERAADEDMPRLLIGDKVITSEPPNCPHQLDLGQAWKDLTGLPFVFAAWMGHADVQLGSLPALLTAARQRGLANIDGIVATHAPLHRWPADIARRYLADYLKFEIGDKQIEAIARFHELAFRHGVFEHEPWRLRT